MPLPSPRAACVTNKATDSLMKALWIPLETITALQRGSWWELKISLNLVLNTSKCKSIIQRSSLWPFGFPNFIHFPLSKDRMFADLTHVPSAGESLQHTLAIRAIILEMRIVLCLTWVIKLKYWAFKWRCGYYQGVRRRLQAKSMPYCQDNHSVNEFHSDQLHVNISNEDVLKIWHSSSPPGPSMGMLLPT